MKTKNSIIFLTSLILAFSGNSQIMFEEIVMGELNQRVTGIISADFDLDNDLDIITCMRTENKIEVYINNGIEPLSFSSNTIVNNIQGPFYVCAGDINQDNFQDIVVSLIGSNKIIALINPGDLMLSWSMYIVTDNFMEPHGVSIADINGDSYNDIIGNAADDNTIAYWLNNGENPDTWPMAVISNNFLYTQAVEAMDFDNDGDIDILGSALQANKIALWINDGNTIPNFEETIITSSFSMAHDACFGDVNEDGFTDIVGASYGLNQVACWINSGSSPLYFTKMIIDNDLLGALSVEVSDIDNDGDADAVCTAWESGEVAWYENEINGSGGWEKHIISASYQGAWPICLADIEGDNDIDILTGADLLNNSGVNGTFTLWKNLLYTTKIESSIQFQEDIKIYYNKASNEVWITPNSFTEGNQIIRIVDSLGRLLLSSKINCQNSIKSILKLPSNVRNLKAINISVINEHEIIASKTLIVK